MNCTNCGAELAPGDSFCGRCGTPRPRVPPRFAEVERRFAALRARYQAGELSNADYNAELQRLVVEDDTGGHWMLSADGDEWYWHDGQQWVRRDPSSVMASVGFLQVQAMPPPAAAPPYMATPPPKKGLPWLWISVGCGGLLLVGLIVIAVVAVAAPQVLPSLSAMLQSPNVDATVTQIAADVYATQTAEAPTATPAPTDTPTPGPVTVRVAADGSGDFPSLEAAIEAVYAGSTILLDPGTYRLEGPLEINKALTLTGAGMDQTFVVGEAGEYVVHFVGSGTFFAEGITFRYDGTAWADVVVIEDGEVDFYRCRFTGGVWSDEDRRGTGLVFRGSATGRVRESQAEGNELHGFEIRDQAQPTLEENVCKDNEVDGILYTDDAGGVARGNECSGSDFGIVLVDRARPTLEENVCTDNERAGIAYFGDAGGTTRQNECTGNKWGISVADQAQPTLEENVCKDNEVDGILYSGDAGGVARGNECSGSAYGIAVTGRAQPTLEENICTDNGSAGIAYLDETGGTARQNECARNNLGIWVMEPADPELVDNDCHDNGSAAVNDWRPAGGSAATPTPTSTSTPKAQAPTPSGATPKPTATATQAPIVSQGPLDFEPPTVVYDWSKQGGIVQVVLRVAITGGAPPFTVSHGPTVQGQTMGREYFLEFEWSSCTPIVQSITVESADGQSVRKDYFVPVSRQPWCD
jgi:parallel beta-helix repeat protein